MLRSHLPRRSNRCLYALSAPYDTPSLALPSMIGCISAKADCVGVCAEMHWLGEGASSLVIDGALLEEALFEAGSHGFLVEGQA